MMYVLDTASIEQIKKAQDLYPLAGVTTNPTIIAKENRPFFDILREIRGIIGEESMLHVQVLATCAEQMIAEAECLAQSVGGNLYVKIPVIPEGIKAIKHLKKQGFKITATAIFTAEQALMAAVAGADFVAPYVNRLDSIGAHGTGVVGDIVRMLEQYQLSTKVLAASFKNVQQVHEVALHGVQAITVAPEILDALLVHPLTTSSVKQFVVDWENIYGKNNVITDIR